MRDEVGHVIGYIETGSIVATGEGTTGNNGNEPSVFPMAIENKEVNIYQLEEVPDDPSCTSGPENAGSGYIF